MTAIRNALVLGAGIGGLTATVSLMKKGIGVDLVEINADTTVQGIGISLLGPALRAMKMIGLIDQVVAAGVGSVDTLICNVNCEVVNRIPVARLAGPEYPASVGILRPAFQEILRQAAIASGASIRHGTTFQQINQDTSGVNVTFTDGSTSRYNLVIAADGINSSVRTLFFDPNLKPEKTGQSVWRATIPRLPGVDDLMLVHGPRNTAGFNPVTQDEMYVFLVQNTSEVIRDTGQWPALLREQLKDFGGVMASARESIVDADKIVWRPLETVFCPAPWYRDRIVLLGDAAHATTPHLASGAGQAIEDAIVLAEEMAAKPTLESALEGYMSRRYERSKMVYESSILLGKWEMNPSAVDANPDKLRIDCMRQLAQPL